MSTYQAILDDVEVSGLSMLGNTIYGTSFNDETGILSLDILTWCPDFMIYTLESGHYGFQWVFPMNAGTNVSLDGIEAVYDDSCMASSNGRCFQKFRVTLEIKQCDEEAGGVSLDNHYLLWLTSQPADLNDDSDVENWLELIGADSVNDTVSLFFDLLNFEYFESCESFSFQVSFDANITFYDDSNYNRQSLITSNNPLFVLNNGGEQRLYIQIQLDATMMEELTQADIIDMEMLDIWFCVYSSNNTQINETQFESCFDGGSGINIWYLYSTTSGSTDNGYMTSDDIVIDNSNNLLEQFSFIIPTIEDTESDRFGIQITVELSINDEQTSTVRRVRARSLLTNDGTFNRLGQSFKTESIQISQTNANGGTNNNNGNKNNAVDDLYIVILAIAGLLVVSVGVILYFICKMQKTTSMDQNMTQISTNIIEHEHKHKHKQQKPTTTNSVIYDNVIVTKGEDNISF